MSQLFTGGGQSTGVSALASFPPKKSRVDLLQNGLVGSPCSPRDPQESSPTPQFKSINPSVLSLLHSPTLTFIHDHRKNHSLDWTDLSRQINVSRRKRLLISWLQSPSAVILEPTKIKSDTVSLVSPSISHEEMGPDAMIFVF